MIKTRCQNCLQRSMIVEKCKCMNNYCLDCLPNFNHQCQFNWIEEKKKILSKQNPVVSAKKVENI